MTRALQKTIHVACRELGIDTDTRRQLQLVATGKDSMSEMDEADLKAVLKALEARGFRPHKGKRSRPLAPRADLRLVHILWKKLGGAAKLRDPSRAGLNRFVRSRFGEAWGSVPLDIDDLRDAAKINAVVRALKDWCKREGIEP